MWINGFIRAITVLGLWHCRIPGFAFYKTDLRDRKSICEIVERVKPNVMAIFAAKLHVDRGIMNLKLFAYQQIGMSVQIDACRNSVRRDSE